MTLKGTSKGKKMGMSKRVWHLILLLAFSALFTACGSGNAAKENSARVSYEDIIYNHRIDLLKNEPYYFPSNLPGSETIVSLPLKRFDLIFVGHYQLDPENDLTQIVSMLIPGLYTHVLMYLGKDSDGYAYAVEMNGDEDIDFSVDLSGFHMNGRLYVYCLGSDYTKECPRDEYARGIETYDFMWPKRVEPGLHQRLMGYEKELVATIKGDIQNAFPFQIPLGLDLFGKNIILVNDGRDNGADCSSYITSLFESFASVCLDDVTMQADAFTDYYFNDPKGQKAYLPAEYNPFGTEDIYVSDFLTDYGFHIVNGTPRQTKCPDGRIEVGIPTPQKLFDSPSMVEIEAD